MEPPDKIMKKIHKILLATAVAASFTLINRAGDVVMPPRAMDNQIRTVPGVNNDPNLLQYTADGNARAWEQNRSIAMAPNNNSDQDPNLLQKSASVAGTPKQVQLATEQEFQIAPLR